jgi:hypothetical protein
MSKQLTAEVGNEAIKASPPIAVVGATTMSGMTLQDWVLVATLAYIALQAAWLVWKWWKAARTKGWSPTNE